MKNYPEVSSLLPHRPPMLLVERVVSVEEKTGEAQAVVTPAHLFLRADGTLAPEAYGELVAQGFGVCEAVRRLSKDLTLDGGGYLASLRDMQVWRSAAVGETVTVRTEKMDECFNTYIVQGEVFSGPEKLAQATVYIFMWQGQTPPTP